MVISIIVAVAQNNVIGRKNRLPWHLPADLKHFKELTLHKPIIMGLKTFESVGKPLPGRDNIVLAREPNCQIEGCKIAHSIEEALSLARESLLGKENGEVMICGGASIYNQFLPLAQRIYLTRIWADFEGDTYFPELSEKEWEEKERIDNSPDEQNPYKYSFIVLERKK